MFSTYITECGYNGPVCQLTIMYILDRQTDMESNDEDVSLLSHFYIDCRRFAMTKLSDKVTALNTRVEIPVAHL